MADRSGGRRRLGLVVLGLGAVVLVAAVVLLILRSGGDDDSGTSRVTGFDEVTIRIDGEEFCVLLASSSGERSKGLMDRTDLAGYAGMLFDFHHETSSRFWMKDTPLPLSVAFFDVDGGFVSAADMDPCLHQGSACPTYGPPRAYRWALEVRRGQLPDLGADGSRARLAVGSGRSCHTPLSD